MPGPNDIRAGGAFVEIGVRDETRAALAAIRAAIGAELKQAGNQGAAALVPVNQQMQKGTQVSGRFRVGVQQLAFAVEDAATVWSTSGFQGVIRASTNNLTFLAAQMGSLRLQIGFMAGALTAQLLPTLIRMTTESSNAADAIEDMRRSLARGEAIREQNFERSLIPGMVALIRTSEQAENQIRQVQEQIGRLNAVDVVTTDRELTQLEALKRFFEAERGRRGEGFFAGAGGFLAGGLDNLPDIPGVRALQELVGDLPVKLTDALTGIESPEEALKTVEEAITEAKTRQVSETERLVTLNQKLVALQERADELRQQERALGVEALGTFQDLRRREQPRGDTPILRGLDFGTVEAAIERLELSNRQPGPEVEELSQIKNAVNSTDGTVTEMWQALQAQINIGLNF